MIRPNFGDLFASRLAYIEEIIDLKFKHHSMHFDQVFKVKDTDRSYEEVTGLTGFGLFSVKEEGAAVTYDERRQGFDKRYSQTVYGNGFQQSLELQHWDIDGKFQDATAMLADSGAVSAEMSVWSVLNNSSTTETTPDGVALVSTAHLLAGGGTFSNRVSGDLCLGTLEDALNIFSDFVNDRGLLIAEQPGILIVPPEFRLYAAMLLGSELLPDVASGTTSGITGVQAASTHFNAINPLRNSGLSYFVSPYLTDVDNWWLMGSKDQSPLRVWWGLRPTPDHAVDFDSGNAKTKLLYALAYGAVDWRPLVGGIGA